MSGERSRDGFAWRIAAVASLLAFAAALGLVAYTARCLALKWLFGLTAALLAATTAYRVLTGRTSARSGNGPEEGVEHGDLLDRTVPEVREAAEGMEVDYRALLRAERDGKNRKTLVRWLEGRAEEMKEEMVEREEKTRRRGMGGPEAVEVERAREPLPVRWVGGIRFTRRTARQMGDAVSDYIPRIAAPISPYQFAAKHVFLVFFVALPLALAAPLLALFLHPASLVLLASPVVAFALPWLRLKTMVGDRKREVGEELPFFAIHAAILQSVGLNLYESLKSTIGEGVLKRIEQGARFARKNVRVFSRSPTRSLEELGRNHPHGGMRTLLLGYTSEWRAGGDLSSYLEDKAEQHLRLAQHRWDDYRRSVSSVVEIMLTGLFVLPILVLMAVFLSPGSAFSMGMIFIVVGLPLILALGYSLIRSEQPRDYTEYSGNLVLPVVLAPIAFLAAWPLAASWVAVSAAMGVGLLSYGAPVLIERRRALAHEESVPEFLRDVTEYQKLNYPLSRSVETLWREEKYTGEFNELLGNVVGQLQTGVRFSELRVPTRSWLTRLAFFHLGQISESGALATRSMELLTEFMTRVKDTRDEVRSETRMYRLISATVPFGLALIVGMMMGMFSVFSMPELAAGGAPVGGLGTLGVLTQTPPLFDVIAKVTIVSSSIGISFLTSYAADLTPKNLAWPALNSFFAAAAVGVLPAISEMVTGFLGF